MRLPEDLQRAVEETGALVRYRYPWWLRPILMRGVAGITLGRRVYLDGGNVEQSLRHELVHVKQIARLGMIRFYRRWICEYARNRRRGMPSNEAYRRISFEEEAFAEENI